MKASILIVEDEAITALDLRSRLIDLGYDVGLPAGSGEEAVERALRERPSCVLIDINLIGGMNGIEVAEKIRETGGTPIIFISGYSNSEMKSRAMRTGPLAYLDKPVDIMVIDGLLKGIGR